LTPHTQNALPWLDKEGQRLPHQAVEVAASFHPAAPRFGDPTLGVSGSLPTNFQGLGADYCGIGFHAPRE